MDTETTTPANTRPEPQDGPGYRQLHGAEDWSPAEIEAQQNLAAIRDYATAA
jgi:hypothetical protein